MNIPPSPEPVNVPPFAGRTPAQEKLDKEQGIRGTLIIDGKQLKVREDQDIEEVVKRERARKR